MLTTFLQHPNKVHKALAYAYEKRMAPIFHEEIARETYDLDPYAEIYAIDADFVRKVSKFIDDHWLAKTLNAVQFNKLEDAFGGYKANRMELAFAIRYMQLDGRFDTTLYQAILKDAPVEAHSILDDYTTNDVDLE